VFSFLFLTNESVEQVVYMRSDFTQTNPDATCWANQTRRNLSISRHGNFIAPEVSADVARHHCSLGVSQGS
jgi:hypothetical protein